jgi:ribulose-5-phosphate 4-epimerase/fuculose-1-phosphate aldolase
MSEAEWKTRCDLAALYRILHKLRWTDLIYTHMSARVPGEPEHFLINNFGEMFDEVTASSLVKLDFDGTVRDNHALEQVNNAGFVIHSAVYMARPDVHCVLHLHTRASIAVSAQKHGLLPLSQHAMMVLGSLAYHDYNIAAGRLEEREALGKDCAKGDAVILRNHGTLAMGCSIPNAFERMYYLETSCQIQVETMSCGQELIMIDQEVLQRSMARGPLQRAHRRTASMGEYAAHARQRRHRRLPTLVHRFALCHSTGREIDFAILARRSPCK